MVKASVPVKQLQMVQQRKQNKINKLLEKSILKPIAEMRKREIEINFYENHELVYAAHLCGNLIRR
jgi:hypothetical protein